MRYLIHTSILICSITGSAVASVPGNQSPVKPILCTVSSQAIDQSAAATMQKGSPGMIVEVAQGDLLLYRGAYGVADLEQNIPVSGDSVFQLASITKQFTAAAIMSLVEEGKLSLDDRLEKYVPELAAARDVRLYDLLVQTSGISDFAGDQELLSEKSMKKTPQQMVEKIRQITEKLHFPPGSKWEYSNSNYVLLGVIAERVTGQKLADLFNVRLFSRAGIKSLNLDVRSDIVKNRVKGYIKDKSSPYGFRNAEWLDPTIPGAAGALRGTASDLFRWNSALFGGRVVSLKSVSRMTTPGMLADGRTTKFGMPQSWQDGLDSDYGMGVFIKQTEAGQRIFHSGDIDGFSTWLAYYPQSKISIIMLVNSESTSLDVDAVEKAVFGKDEAPCLQHGDRN